MEQLFLVTNGQPHVTFDILSISYINRLLKAGAAVKSVTPIHGSENSEAYVLLEVPDGIDPHEVLSRRGADQSRSPSSCK